MDQPFKHTPFKNSTSQIRLLEILSGQDHEPIWCTLRTYTPKNNLPQYTAISYTWGDSTITETIHLNEQPFSVTRNAWHALWQMRHHQLESRCYWMDSICINQDDTEERNHQVSVMHLVFSRATDVAACLGEMHADLADIQQRVQKYHTVWSTSEMEDSPGHRAVRSLQALPYFRRLWIVQELYQANAVTFHLGTETIDERFLNLYSTEYELYHRRTCRKMDFELPDAIIKYSHRSCSEPRDKIYALLALSNKANCWLPEYDHALWDVLYGYIYMCWWNLVRQERRISVKCHMVSRILESSALLIKEFCTYPDFEIEAGKYNRLQTGSLWHDDRNAWYMSITERSEQKPAAVDELECEIFDSWMWKGGRRCTWSIQDKDADVTQEVGVCGMPNGRIVVAEEVSEGDILISIGSSHRGLFICTPSTNTPAIWLVTGIALEISEKTFEQIMNETPDDSQPLELEPLRYGALEQLYLHPKDIILMALLNNKLENEEAMYPLTFKEALSEVQVKLPDSDADRGSGELEERYIHPSIERAIDCNDIPPLTDLYRSTVQG